MKIKKQLLFFFLILIQISHFQSKSTAESNSIMSEDSPAESNSIMSEDSPKPINKVKT